MIEAFILLTVVFTVLSLVAVNEIKRLKGHIRFLERQSESYFADIRGLLGVVNTVFFSESFSLGDQSRMANLLFNEKDLDEYKWRTISSIDDFFLETDPEVAVQEVVDWHGMMSKDEHGDDENDEDDINEEIDDTMTFFKDKQQFIKRNLPSKINTLNEVYYYEEIRPTENVHGFCKRYDILSALDASEQSKIETEASGNEPSLTAGNDGTAFDLARELRKDPLVTYDMLRNGTTLATWFDFKFVLNYYAENNCDEVLEKHHIVMPDNSIDYRTTKFSIDIDNGLPRNFYALLGESKTILGFFGTKSNTFEADGSISQAFTDDIMENIDDWRIPESLTFKRIDVLDDDWSYRIVVIIVDEDGENEESFYIERAGMKIM